MTLPDSPNIAAHLTRMADLDPTRMAVACPTRSLGEGRCDYSEITFGRLDEWSTQVARGMLAHGLKPGTRVGLLLPPGESFFCIVFALMKAGAVMVCVDPGIGIKQMGRCLNEAGPEAIIGIRKAHIACRLFGWGRETCRTSIHVDHRPLRWWPRRTQALTLDNLVESSRQSDAPALPEVAGSDLAAILYTSGSTGPPKGVVYTHDLFQQQIKMLKQTYRIEPGEIDLCTFPLFALFAPGLGMSSVVPDMDFTRPAAVSPTNVIRPIQRFNVTNLFGSPALLNRVGRWLEENPTTLPSLRRIISAGAPVPASVMRRLTPTLCGDASIHTPYGATEALPVATIDSGEILSETEEQTNQGKGVCIGRPVDGLTARIIPIMDCPVTTESGGNPPWLPTGEYGEIVVSGPNVTEQYDRQEKATRWAKFHDTNGRLYHRMGDIGYFDETGRLWFCGRMSHRVVTEDATFYSVPCEGVFNTHPKVYRTALVRLTSSGKSVPGLCVELEPNTPKTQHDTIRKELLKLGSQFEHTREIRELFFHSGFPVDTRHNAKINRDLLGTWAMRRRS
jgi:acyl-CoA synthetase (AMP-forming)/AMP-acid ligase II